MAIKILSVFGTRPEAIKMAPLVKEFEKNVAFESLVCVTAQHRDMLDMVLSFFEIIPDWDLNIMKKSQTLPYITATIIEKLSEVLAECKPDIILVHGDTSTSFVAALAGFYMQIPVGHVEAGLRSFNKYSPFPEEVNRVLTGHIANLHFAPTKTAKQNLLRENITQDIYVTGNTVIDALKYTVKQKYIFEEDILNTIDYNNKRIVLLTAHRRENLGEPMQHICSAVKRLAKRFDDVEFVFPVHKNPAVRETVFSRLSDTKGVHLIDPIHVLDMHNLMARSHLILTDSGGLQEEAPALHKPVLVLRTETERPEAIECGGALLLGTDEENIVDMVSSLLEDENRYYAMKNIENPYGDGNACTRIASHIENWFKTRGGASATEG